LTLIALRPSHFLHTYIFVRQELSPYIMT